jgi:hypothetical protein
MAQDPLNLLCIEPRFPGRLGAVADWLVRHRGYRCWLFCASTDAPEHWSATAGKGLEVVGYQTGGVANEPAVTWIRYLERGLCHAYGCWETLHSRRPRRCRCCHRQPFRTFPRLASANGNERFTGSFRQEVQRGRLIRRLRSNVRHCHYPYWTMLKENVSIRAAVRSAAPGKNARCI